MIRYVKINISCLLFSIVFVLVNFYSNNANAYNCYGTSNAGTVAPDNGTVCAGMYIVPNILGTGTAKGAKKLLNATHSGSNAYITYGGEKYWFGEEAGKKKIFTGQVVNFNRVFYNKKNFDADIGYWDMSRAVVTSEMFKNARSFNQDIGDWNMSKNKWYWGMFYNAQKFNQDISGWDTGNARSFSTMFLGAKIFDQDIGGWNTEKVFTMYHMFRNAKKFNQDIGSWDTSKVTDFTYMFLQASAFNNGGSDSINNWNVSKATTMRGMFHTAINFNQPISNWSLKKNTNRSLLRQFLQKASKYNKDLTCLDVSHFPDSRAPQSFSNGSLLTSSQKPQWGQSVPASCTAAPTLSSSSPADNDLNISNTANIFLTFDENVNAGDGDIIIKKTTDNSIFETIAANSNLVTGTGTDVIEINPSNTFASGTEYYVVIDSDAFKDLTGNYYAGISSTTALSFTTLDSTNPSLSSSSPAHLDTDVAVDTNIVLNFSEAVDVESGNITIKKTSDDSTVETIDVTSTQVTGSGSTQITINPSSALDDSTEFYLIIDATAFDDAAGNSYAGIDNTNSMLSFTSIDNTNPTLSSSVPVDNATGVSAVANITLTFSEAVDVESGNITIKKTSDDSTLETVDVTENKVTGTGTNQITINPSNTFSSSTEYYVLIDATAFDDAAGNSYAGISSTTALSFTSQDTGNPYLTSTTPAHQATGIAVNTNIVLNFSENVDVESGNITIKKTSDDTSVETIDVTGNTVTGSGSTQITINPSSNLDEITSYYLIIDATAFDDASGNSFGGISSKTTYNFTTVDNTNPTLSSSAPADNATGVGRKADIFLTFSEAVDVESGNITIKKTSDDDTFETIDVTGNKVTGSGSTIIKINPSNTFASGTEYYILIDATAFDDAAGNSYAGISSTTALSFTSKDTVKPYLTSTVPAHLATDIATNANIVLNFSETVVAQSGGHYITIFNKSDDSEFEKIDVTNAKVSGSGTNQITINPGTNFVEKSIYYIKIDATAFDDSSGNSYGGISGTNKYKFTIVDSTNPTLSTSSPTDGATNVNTLSSLVLTFDEDIDAETGGEIYLYKSDDTLVKTYSVTDTDYVNRSSGTTYTVDISAELDTSTSYYIKINASAFDDTAGNSYAGISDTTTLNFTTASTNCGCVAGQLTNKNNVVQSGASVQLLDSSNNLIDTATTDDEGRYDLYPSTTGTYKVLFVKSSTKKWKAKNAHGKFNGRYVEEIEFSTNCEEYMDMDAILIDPAGVVYNSSTRAAISGATVRLFFGNSIVNNDWLDSETGTNTEVTDSDGQYNFVLNGNASSGTYTLEVEPPSGYIFESDNIPAETSAYIPSLGAGIETVQDQSTAPTTSEETTYYLSFEFTIETLASDTSNGVIHNHIPVDPIAASGKELINKVKAPLTKVLKQDFHDTVSGQMNDFSSIARQSIRRLEKNNSKFCENKETKSSLTEERLLRSIESGELSEKFLKVNGNCRTNKNVYTDVQYKVTTSSKVGIQYLLQVNQTREAKINNNKFRGIFYGAYTSDTKVKDSATGKIEGIGFHSGIYETLKFNNIHLNYYVSGSTGKHDFDFDMLTGLTPDKIKTKGDYGYYAAFTGASISGEKRYDDLVINPRLIFDTAYAETDQLKVDFTAEQKNIEQTGDLELNKFYGSKGTYEITFTYPTTFNNWDTILEITPRGFCQDQVGEIKATCGIGNNLVIEGINNKYGNIDLVLDFEEVEGIRRESYQLSHSIIIFTNGEITSGYSIDENLNGIVATNFNYNF
ncbi:Ig-like domain-containing protein [Pelagibacteraceae bacterium]|nr:Ig-like domain-containing protein [Pelagibacteraceae bacterium]